MSTKSALRREDDLNKDNIHDAINQVRRKKEPKTTKRVTSFGSLPIGQQINFSIPGSYSGKQYYKVTPSYAREVNTRDWVPMMSGDDVEIIA